MKSKRFFVADRKQFTLMPPVIDDWVSQDHEVRFVVDIIKQLDLSDILNKYGDRGARAYHPEILLGLLIYGYMKGIFSSRKLEAATYDLISFRFLTGNQHPDHDTIANFRKRFLPEISDCFLQVVLIANEMGLVRLGAIHVDGTKVKANASKHKAMSYKHMQELEKKLKVEIEEILKQAEIADEEEQESEEAVPDDLRSKQERLSRIEQAMKDLEARSEAKYNAELKEYEQKMEVWDEKAKKKERRGCPPKPPKSNKPKDKDQINFTDPESRIMKTKNGFDQCYNGQAAATQDMLIVGQTLSNHAADVRELLPTIDNISDELGRVEKVVADNGYFSENNLQGCKDRGISSYLSMGREGKGNKVYTDKPLHEEQKERLETEEGKALYRKRKYTIEPIFGIIKSAMGFRQFSMRGEANVRGEWGLVCLAYNVKRMFSMINGAKGGNTGSFNLKIRLHALIGSLVCCLVVIFRELRLQNSPSAI